LQGQLTTERVGCTPNSKAISSGPSRNQRLSGYRTTVLPNPAIRRYLDKAG